MFINDYSNRLYCNTDHILFFAINESETVERTVYTLTAYLDNDTSLELLESEDISILKDRIRYINNYGKINPQGYV